VEGKALVVDGRQDSQALLAGDLADAGFEVIEACDGIDAWRKFHLIRPDLVVSNLRVPFADGFELLRRIRGVSSTPVILFASNGDVATAVAAIKGGADEFFSLPDDRDRIAERARELMSDRADADVRDELSDQIVGSSAASRRLRDRVRALAPLQVPVLVTGERGVGHDHTVRCLHERSDRAAAKLVVIGSGEAGLRQCGAATAFYLDEIGRFAPADQVYWFERLRESRSREADSPRIFASSSDDLAALARNDSFHPRLARCLLRFRVHIAPLRERAGDVDPLVRHHVRRLAREMGRSDVSLDADAIDLLRARPWPGNIGELCAAVERLVAFSPGGEITANLVRDVLGESPNSVALLRRQREQRLRSELVEVLESCGGNLAEVGRRLGVSRGAVIYRAQKFGLLPRSS
jgi:DNA-binding NtrC family response regulator